MRRRVPLPLIPPICRQGNTVHRVLHTFLNIKWLVFLEIHRTAEAISFHTFDLALLLKFPLLLLAQTLLTSTKA